MGRCREEGLGEVVVVNMWPAEAALLAAGALGVSDGEGNGTL
jgi:hypothetical protein